MPAISCAVRYVRARAALTRSCMATVSRVEVATAASICAEVGDGALVGDQQGRHDGVGDRVVEVVGEADQRRRQVAALRPDVERLHLVTDGGRRDACRLADRLVQAGVGDQQVAQHLGPDGDRLRAGQLLPAVGPQPDEGRDHPAEQPQRRHQRDPPGPPVGRRRHRSRPAPRAGRGGRSRDGSAGTLHGPVELHPTTPRDDR